MGESSMPAICFFVTLLMVPLEYALSLRIIKTLDSTCRPNAFTFCEMPVITSLSENPYPVFPGEEFRLQCQAFGSPQPIISWFRVLPNGESIDISRMPGHHMINDAGTLRIRHVVPHDDGKYFCMASNSVGESKALIEIKVSHPLVFLIPLSVGDSFVKLTWNGTVNVFPADGVRTTRSDRRHHHHVEARYRLSRHLVLKLRRYKDSPTMRPSPTTSIKLSPHAKHYTAGNLSPNTPYEFCIEFQPTDRPTTLLDCLIVRTTTNMDYEDRTMGYHQGQTLLFLLLMIIVGSGSFLCFGCYTMAIGRKLWKYRNKKGFSSLGYDNQLDKDTEESNTNYQYAFVEDNPRKPLIARI